jgi:hypothetical protein
LFENGHRQEAVMFASDMMELRWSDGGGNHAAPVQSRYRAPRSSRGEG